MYALLFHFDLIGIFDQTGSRAHVYANWGPQYQKSGKGPDNARTNLLESIVSIMLPAGYGQTTQRVWLMMRYYCDQFPRTTTRQDVYDRALVDPARNTFTDDDRIAIELLQELGDDWDVSKIKQVSILCRFCQPAVERRC